MNINDEETIQHKRITKLPDHDNRADLNNLTMENRIDTESNRSK